MVYDKEVEVEIIVIKHSSFMPDLCVCICACVLRYFIYPIIMMMSSAKNNLDKYGILLLTCMMMRNNVCNGLSICPMNDTCSSVCNTNQFYNMEQCVDSCNANTTIPIASGNVFIPSYCKCSSKIDRTIIPTINKIIKHDDNITIELTDYSSSSSFNLFCFASTFWDFCVSL